MQGWHSWLVRIWDGLTFGVHRRQIRVAEQTGNAEALTTWMDRKQQAMREHRARLMELPLMLMGLLKVVVVVLLAMAVLIPLIAALVWATGGDGIEVFRWCRDTLRWIFDAIAFVWPWFVVSLPVLFVVAGWREGRRRGKPPLLYDAAVRPRKRPSGIIPKGLLPEARPRGLEPLTF
ncbi:hypothetical protein ABZW11_13860 [Nonomuraea sp. NPDC004580]|uniref:hypothetical protein n=1 Tax=Nonomuraea sp. NPDC004580 TaxID=3154552 RepID=UPI0033BCB1B3